MFIESLVLRRIINIANSIGIDIVVTPLYLNYPIYGKLEIQIFGCTYIESLNLRSGRQTMLYPLIIFINMFGLYCNLYRLLIGIYFILVLLSSRERDRRANVFPLTLGLYGSNFVDIVEVIKLLTVLDRSVEVYIPRIGTILLIAFTFAFLSNIP